MGIQLGNSFTLSHTYLNFVQVRVQVSLNYNVFLKALTSFMASALNNLFHIRRKTHSQQTEVLLPILIYRYPQFSFNEQFRGLNVKFSNFMFYKKAILRDPTCHLRRHTPVPLIYVSKIISHNFKKNTIIWLNANETT